MRNVPALDFFVPRSHFHIHNFYIPHICRHIDHNITNSTPIKNIFCHLLLSRSSLLVAIYICEHVFVCCYYHHLGRMIGNRWLVQDCENLRKNYRRQLRVEWIPTVVTRHGVLLIPFCTVSMSLPQLVSKLLHFSGGWGFKERERNIEQIFTRKELN